jgi:urease accessory protein
LLALGPRLVAAADECMLEDALEACGWGLALASKAHETQYSRLFRS